MAITAAQVKELREMTGAGMMDCKKALTATDADMDKAVEWLREKGLATAQKKAGRIAAEGLCRTLVSDDEKKAVVVEVNAETDFVAKNAEFQAFVKTVAETVMAENPADVADLLTKKAVGTEMTVAELLQEKIQTIGENIVIRRFKLYEGAVAAYIHAGGKISVLVKFDTDAADKDGFAAYAKDIAMQVAAANPSYLNKEDVPAEVLDHEKEIMIAQMKQDPKMANKPDQVLEKIVMGKVGKYYEENCLNKQAFIKENKITVEQYTAQTAKSLGGNITIAEFVRFEKGEGLEKRNDDFAAEVASLAK